MSEYDCDMDKHEIDDEVRFISISSKSTKAEVYCKHCDYWAEVDYILDESAIRWQYGE
jgi:hypothetical protein